MGGLLVGTGLGLSSYRALSQRRPPLVYPQATLQLIEIRATFGSVARSGETSLVDRVSRANLSSHSSRKAMTEASISSRLRLTKPFAACSSRSRSKNSPRPGRLADGSGSTSRPAPQAVPSASSLRSRTWGPPFRSRGVPRCPRLQAEMGVRSFSRRTPGETTPRPGPVVAGSRGPPARRVPDPGPPQSDRRPRPTAAGPGQTAASSQARPDVIVGIAGGRILPPGMPPCERAVSEFRPLVNTHGAAFASCNGTGRRRSVRLRR